GDLIHLLEAEQTGLVDRTVGQWIESPPLVVCNGNREGTYCPVLRKHAKRPIRGNPGSRSLDANQARTSVDDGFIKVDGRGGVRKVVENLGQRSLPAIG